jgi:predicted nucleic acid-binding Zn ribbon protein
MLEDTDTRIAVHEAICAERYKRIEEMLDAGEKRMTKIEYLLYGVIAAVLLGPGVAAEVVKKLAGV